MARALEVGVWPLPVRDMVWMVIIFHMRVAGGVVADVRVPVRIGPGRKDIHITCHGTANAAEQEKLVTVTDSDGVHATLVEVCLASHRFVSHIVGRGTGDQSLMLLMKSCLSTMVSKGPWSQVL